jgi:hypothetical protein
MATSVIMMELLGREYTLTHAVAATFWSTSQCWPASAGVLARGRSIRLSRMSLAWSTIR